MGHVSWTEACNLLLAVRCCLKSSCGENYVNFSLSSPPCMYKPDMRVPICESANSGPPHARETRRCTPQLWLPSLQSHSKHPVHVYVYVCLYVCVCVCVCARARARACTYLQNTYMHTCMHSCVHFRHTVSSSFPFVLLIITPTGSAADIHRPPPVTA